jgi:DMSO/TMAO reductase YedYZ molybdopterin-dependent catalytic subunit
MGGPFGAGKATRTHRDGSNSVRTQTKPAGAASSRPTTPPFRGAVVGVLTALFALGVAEVAASLIDDQSSPLVAVGSAAIDGTPEWLKSFAIRTFGSNDKRALIVGMLVVILIIAALLGIASIRRPWVGFTGLWILATVGAVAALSRPTGSVLSIIPSIVGALAASYALPWLLKAAQPSGVRGSPQGPVETPGDLDRRRFLFASLTIGGAAVAMGGLGRFVISRRFGVAEAARDALTIPKPTDVAPPPPAGFDTPGISPFITPNTTFYRVDSALVVPRVDTDSWRLTIHGMVDHEMELTLDDLMARDLIERDITLTCVSNEVGGTYIGNARWIGAPLTPLLEEAGVQTGADQIVSRSVDGFTVGTPTSVVMDGRDSMLAISMNGETLPFTHGFPVRMIVPGLYGYVSATKWLTDIELTTFDAYDAYWVQRGWAQQAAIKTESRIDTPHSKAKVGTVMVAGVAWAQHRGIERVEVRVNEDEWHDATLSEQDTTDTWRQWRWPWEATAGSYTLQVRATDADGATQPEQRVTPFPNGATGWHTVAVVVG